MRMVGCHTPQASVILLVDLYLMTFDSALVDALA